MIINNLRTSLFNFVLTFSLYLRRYLLTFLEKDSQVLPSENIEPHDFIIRERNWIQEKLRAYPFWGSGLKLYGAHSITLGDPVAAYGAAQAMRALFNRTPNQAVHWKRLLAKCYIGTGEYERAETILRELVDSPQVSDDDLEDLAAALITQERFKEAEELLESLPESRRRGGRNSAIIAYLKGEKAYK